MTAFSAAMVADAVEAAGLAELPENALIRLADYGNLLVKWNSRMNLTAIRDPSAILERHIVESVSAAQFLPAGVRTLLDFGSGAGLPGVPIAVCREEIAVTLAESQSKKSAFLAEVARSLGLQVRVHAGRVESLPVAAKYDVVALRAVDKMMEAVKEARSRVAEGGYLLLFATSGTREELVRAAEAGSVAERGLPHAGSLLLCKIHD